jgi:hypothetical protein
VIVEGSLFKKYYVVSPVVSSTVATKAAPNELATDIDGKLKPKLSDLRA